MTNKRKQESHKLFADGREVCSESARLMAFIGAALSKKKRWIAIRLPDGEFVGADDGDATTAEPVSEQQIETYLASREAAADGD